MGSSVVIKQELLKKVCLPIEIIPQSDRITNIEKFICKLHNGLLVDPVIDEKGHSFCQVCLDSYLEQCKICPVDKKHELKTKYFKKDSETENFIRNHSAVCTNLKNGCKWSGKVFQFSEHLKICPKELKDCPSKGCSTKYFFEDALDHRNNCEYFMLICKFCNAQYIRKDMPGHVSVCDEVPLDCSNKCGEVILRKLMNKHIKDDCNNTIIKCPFPECDAVEKRQYIYFEHVSNCVYRRINCRYCNNEIKFCDETYHFNNTCQMIPIPCTLNCNLILPRGEVPRHMEKYCENYILKCKWRCQFKQERKFIQTHEAECEFRIVNCQYCNKGIEFGSLEIHYQTCGFYPIKCTQDCDEGMIRNDLPKHIQYDCINTIIPCTYEEFGCTFVMKRKNLKEHVQTSIFEHHDLVLNYVAKLRSSVNKLENKQLNFENQTRTSFDNVNSSIRTVENNFNTFSRQTTDRERVLEYNLVKKIDDLGSSLKRDINNTGNEIRDANYKVDRLKSDIDNVTNRVSSIEFNAIFR